MGKRPAAPALAALCLAAACLACGADNAGPPGDAGAQDAGAADSGQDAGPHDAGSSDAGSSDAGSSDAGSSDAGSSDAGSSDAGSSDAGSSDAGSADGGADAGAPILTGVLMAGPGPAPGYYSGVDYLAGSESGSTDSSGTFHYPAGASIAFSVGGLTLGTAPGAAQITPFTLAGGCAITPQLTALLVFLQSLDTDGDASNGVQLAHFGAVLSGALAQLSQAQLAATIAQLKPGQLPVTNQAALDAFIAQVDGEAWTQASQDTFSLLSGGVRSQGITSDGASWFFSWQYGLERTDLSYGVQKQALEDIPIALVAQGSDHIGDIDVNAGTIYAGIEDSKHYAHPMIAQFDASSLSFLSANAVDVSVQPDGVPWVAYDAAKSVVYSSAWNPSPGINVFDPAHGMTLVKTIALSPALSRIQGAKMYRGFLYGSLDLTIKTIYKMNLETGTALPVFTMDLGAVEEEGLAFLERPDGTAMHTQNVAANKTGMELRHHQRTRAPLRDAICP